MRFGIAVLIILLGIAVSSIIVFITNTAPPNLPLSIFAVACTILLAAIVFPQFAVGLSGSKIAKGLLFEFYNNWIHWLFLIYQVILAISAIIAEHAKTESFNPKFLSHSLLFLIVFDLFYLLWYLVYLIERIAAPELVLQTFVRRLLRKIDWEAKNRRTNKFVRKLRMIARIAREANSGYEKSVVLEALNNLLQPVTNIASSKKQELTILPVSQFESWKLLVESISSACTDTDELCSANDANTCEAIRISWEAWRLINNWPKSGYDYAACPRAIARLGHFAVSKGYHNSIHLAAGKLASIAEESIEDSLQPRTSPFEIANSMAKIGVATAIVGRGDSAEPYIGWLLYFSKLTEKDANVYMFYTLNLVSFIWEKDKDALGDLCYRLDQANVQDVLNATLEYGRANFPRETERIERFLNAAGYSIKEK